MAAKKRLTDATETHFIIRCPACGQQYAIFGLAVQDDEEMACSTCNALFHLKITEGNVEPRLVRPATGGALGPAEGPRPKRG